MLILPHFFFRGNLRTLFLCLIFSLADLTPFMTLRPHVHQRHNTSNTAASARPRRLLYVPNAVAALAASSDVRSAAAGDER